MRAVHCIFMEMCAPSRPCRPAAFPFFYIEPQLEENAKIIKRFNKKKVPIDKFAPIGQPLTNLRP